MLPLTINIKDAYANGKDDEQKFIQNLSLFLCTFLKEHGQLVEKKVHVQYAMLDMHFKIICLTLTFQCTWTTRAKTSVRFLKVQIWSRRGNI